MEKLFFKLKIQMFSEEEHKEEPKEDSEVVKAVKEEYETKLEKQKNEYETKIKNMSEEHIKTIRAIMSGKGKIQETTIKEKELSFEEKLLNNTRKKFGLKGGNEE